MKNILVPTDFSDTSSVAFRYALMLAEKSSLNVYVLHVLDMAHALTEHAPQEGVIPSLVKYMAEAKDNAKNSLSAFVKVNTQVKVHEIIDAGDPKSVLLSKAKELEIDMIVMGTKGTSGLKELFVGSVTEKVVRFSSIPVLTLSLGCSLSSIKRMVFANDFDGSEPLDMSIVKKLMHDWAAKIHLLRINTPYEFLETPLIQERMKKFVDAHRLQNYSGNEYAFKRIQEGVFKFCEEVDADVIVMTTHGRKGLDHFFSGSRAEDAINHSNYPVLCLPLTQ